MSSIEPEEAPEEIKPKPPRQRRAARSSPSADQIPAPNVVTVESQSKPAESPKEMAARLKQDAEEAKHKRRLGLITKSSEKAPGFSHGDESRVDFLS